MNGKTQSKRTNDTDHSNSSQVLLFCEK